MDKGNPVDLIASLPQAAQCLIFPVLMVPLCGTHPFLRAQIYHWGMCREFSMMDFVFVACTLLFFGLGIVYRKACEPLK